MEVFMVQCKITVLKTMIFDDLIDYCNGNITSCPCFKEGQEFIAGLNKPEGFYDWAWSDLLRFLTALLTGGNFSKNIFEGWMRDDKTMIACCTDGMRPVVFKLERIGSQI
jgi:uncharacterized repeat protein (TIGR04076 family)